MKINQIIKFAGRLIASKKVRNFLVIFSIAISTAVLFLFFSFSSGVQNALLKPIVETSNPETLVVSNDVLSLGFFDVNKGQKLTQKTIEKIADFPEVKNVARLLTLKFPSSLKVWMFGITFETDSPIFAVDADFLGDDLIGDFEEFELNGEQMVPIAISPRIIDAFNTSLAESTEAIPHLDADNLYNRRFQIVFGKSTVFQLGSREPVYRSAQIKAVSPRVPMLGIAIPMSIAREISAEFGTLEKDLVFTKIYVTAHNLEDVASLQSKIQDLGFKVQSFEEIGEELLSLILVFKITLLISAGIMLFISFLSLFSLLYVSVLEQQRGIGILQAIGARRFDIFAIFLTQGLLIALMSVVLGLLFGYLLSLGLDSYILAQIPEISLKPETFFPVSIYSLLILVLAVIFAAFLASFFPARKALQVNPLTALIRP